MSHTSCSNQQINSHIGGLYLSLSHVFFFLLQPKLTDEEGWKRFCLGEKIYQGASSGFADQDTDQEPALDYSKVLKLVIVKLIQVFIL